jgi:PAS domain S-box-containing protein
VALATAALLALDLYRDSVENAVSQFQDHQLLLARHIAEDLASYLNARAPGLRALASLDTVRKRDPERMPRDLDAYRRRLEPAHVPAASVFDEAGTIRYSTLPASIGRSYPRCELVEWGRREANRQSVSLSVLRRPSQAAEAIPDTPSAPRFLLVTPVYRPAGAGRPERFAGVLSLSFDLQAVLSERVVRIEPNSDVWVIENDGTLLFHSAHPELVLRNVRDWAPACGACHVSLDHVERIVARRRGTTAYALRDGAEKLAAFGPMEFGNASWTVVVSAPYTRVAAFARSSLRETLLLLAVVVAGLGGAVVLFWRGQHLTRELAFAAERQQADEALRESEQRYRTIIEHCNDLIWTLDREGRFVFVNRRAEELAGYGLEDRHGRSFQPLVVEEDLPRVGEAFRRALAGEPQQYEVRVRRRDGSVLTLSVNTAPFHAGSAVVGTASFGRDVSDQKRAEEQLRESEEKYRAVFEESKDVIFISTPEGRIVDINPAGVELFGYASRDEMLEGYLARDLHVDPRARATWQREVDLHCFVRDHELVLKAKDGRRLTVLETVTAERDQSGAVVAYRGILRDITEHKGLEEQLHQAQKMEALGQLAGGVAHDFNNLLSVIAGYADLILRRLAPDDVQRPKVEQIQLAGQRAAALTRQLLTFSRKQIVQPTLLDLNAVVTGLEAMLRRLIKEDVEIHTALSAERASVTADRGQIEQVILNLAVNAGDAMPDGGRLVIETALADLDDEYCRRHQGSLPGRHVMLAVSDTGTGMDAETQSHIFEPFFTTKGAGKGTGLGLATVYGIVKQCGGSVWVYSEPGQGTTFKIYLPQAQASEGALPAAAPSAGETAPRGSETILVVEDEEALRVLVCEVLEASGYQVLAARHGVEALEVAEAHRGPIHLLVTDLVMPQMSGGQLANRFATLRPEARVLYTSGYTDDVVARNRLLDPGVPFIPKPFSPDLLVRKIRELLDAPPRRPAS